MYKHTKIFEQKSTNLPRQINAADNTHPLLIIVKESLLTVFRNQKKKKTKNTNNKGKKCTTGQCEEQAEEISAT